MKNPVNLTTTTKKGLTTYWKETPCQRNWLRTNAMTYYITMQLLNIKENWSPLAFRQRGKWLFKGNRHCTSAVSQERTQLSPSLCLPHTGPSRPLALSWVPQRVSAGQMGLNLRQRRNSSESRSCCVTGCPALTDGSASQAFIRYVRTGPPPTRRQPSEETFSDQSPRSQIWWGRPEFSPEINM